MMASTQPSQMPRLRLEGAALQAKPQLAAFHAGNHFVVETRHLSDATGLDPVMLQILTTVAVGAVQRSARERTGESGMLAARPMSRRVIARATGLPRETVRRRICQLVEMGFLEQDGEGVTPADISGNGRMATAIGQILLHHAQITNLLLAEGVFALEPMSQAARA